MLGGKFAQPQTPHLLQRLCFISVWICLGLLNLIDITPAAMPLFGSRTHCLGVLGFTLPRFLPHLLQRLCLDRVHIV